MAAKIRLTKPTDSDLLELAQTLRQADVDELVLMTELSPFDAIVHSVNVSDPEFCFTVRANNRLLCIAGCTTNGMPWLLATDLLADYKKSLTQIAAPVVMAMLLKYRSLHNVVDSRNTASIAWLTSLGFQFGEPYALPDGAVLIPFSKVLALNEILPADCA